ncbi:uncharacterized protein TrAFT101_011838 [Trichoderma asperellum]|uniref:uncharacterized protein n=1 Tax=Trichoderma asperellum TaxID=101201 RepID=UPI0033296754|nr:hypothetical protein TrAFT101_011838 [Trichoderma asperellum]
MQRWKGSLDRAGQIMAWQAIFASDALLSSEDYRSITEYTAADSTIIQVHQYPGNDLLLIDLIIHIARKHK